MSAYRTIVLDVEARQLNGENAYELGAWVLSKHTFVRFIPGNNSPNTLYVKTMDGKETQVNTWDWIVEDQFGRFSVVSSNKFASLYEAVDD